MADVEGPGNCTASSEASFEVSGKEEKEFPRERKTIRSVLVVDDLYFNRMLLGKLLASFGFLVSYSSDGQEAVEEFQRRKRRNEELYAILMDVNMPTMDGLMATKHIRSIEAASTELTPSTPEPCRSSSSASSTEQSAGCPGIPGRRVPIVGVSASSSADQLKSAALHGVELDLATEQPWAAVGMDLFMEKPVNRDKLRRMLDLLEHDNWRGSSSSSTDIPAPVDIAKPEQAAQDMQHVGILESQRCDSLGSFSSGVDIKVSSRPGGQQVAKRSLGGTMDLAEQARTSHSCKRCKANISDFASLSSNAVCPLKCPAAPSM